MPQFDQFSFFNQVAFFLFFLFNFYFFISYYFLPKISSNIKFRKKFINSKINEKNLLNLEIKIKQIFYTNLFKKINLNYFTIFNTEFNSSTINYLFSSKINNLLFIQKIKNLLNKKFILFKKYL